MHYVTCILLATDTQTVMCYKINYTLQGSHVQCTMSYVVWYYVAIQEGNDYIKHVNFISSVLHVRPRGSKIEVLRQMVTTWEF